MLIDTLKYKESLIKLWMKVFGDEYGYVSLLFEDSPPECFAELSDGKIISALYLLEGEILIGDKVYSGRYLYCAATEKSFRGKGYMAKLIAEAQNYCRERLLDFICLVPANDGLYDYYSRFDFKEGLYRYRTVVGKNICQQQSTSSLSADEVYERRRLYGGNQFIFSHTAFSYAARTLIYSGAEFIAVGDDGVAVREADSCDFLEYVSPAESLIKNTQELLSCFDKEGVIYSPFEMSEYGECVKERFGMIYCINKSLEEITDSEGIYMNIALD